MMSESNHRAIPKLTLLSVVITANVLLAVGLFLVLPTKTSNSGIEYDYSEDYRHGWPATYMTRDSVIPSGGMTPGGHAPWPFFGDPPLRSFHLGWLFFDAVVGLILAAVAIRTAVVWSSRRRKILQRLLTIGLGVIGVTCVVAMPIACRIASDFYARVTTVPFDEILFSAAAIIVYGLSRFGFAFVCWATMRQLLMWGLPARWADPRLVQRLLIEKALAVLFVCFVVNHYFSFDSAWPLLTKMTVAAFALLAVMAAGAR